MGCFRMLVRIRSSKYDLPTTTQEYAVLMAKKVSIIKILNCIRLGPYLWMTASFELGNHLTLEQI